MTPPPNRNKVPIIHNIRILHKDLYVFGQKITKKDKLGIHSTVEKNCIDILSLSIETAYKTKSYKKEPLELLRIKIGVLQNLIRTEKDLGILGEKTYLHISQQIIEISKMTSGWINYLNTK